MSKIEDYLNKGKYPYFSSYEKIHNIDGKEELIIGKDKYFSVMDTYIAKCITDKEYNKDEVIEKLINIILTQLELKAYNNIRLPDKCFIRQDFEHWEYKINSSIPNVQCIALMCRVGFLNSVKLKDHKTYMFYESDYTLTKEVIDIYE